MYKLHVTRDPVRWSVWTSWGYSWALVSTFASEQAAVNYIHSRRIGDAIVVPPEYFVQ